MQTNQLDVVSLNRSSGVALLSNDAIVPVTNWFDFEGDECEEHLATTCVCGDADNGWFAVDLSDFTWGPLN